jgi:hypothetical protein
MIVGTTSSATNGNVIGAQVLADAEAVRGGVNHVAADLSRVRNVLVASTPSTFRLQHRSPSGLMWPPASYAVALQVKRAL